jgi:hypothetical protein
MSHYNTLIENCLNTPNEKKDMFDMTTDDFDVKTASIEDHSTHCSERDSDINIPPSAHDKSTQEAMNMNDSEEMTLLFHPSTKLGELFLHSLLCPPKITLEIHGVTKS